MYDLRKKTMICPACTKKNLSVLEIPYEIPYFGKVKFLSMNCSNCSYRKNEVETESKRKPAKYSIDIDSEADMKIRIVKDSQASVEIPGIIKLESTPSSSGFITNIEGLLLKLKNTIRFAKDNLEEEEKQKKAQEFENLIDAVIDGKSKLTLIIEDNTGNSAIISDKAKKETLAR